MPTDAILSLQAHLLQGCLMRWEGGRLRRGGCVYMYIIMTDLSSCTAETNTTL